MSFSVMINSYIGIFNLNRKLLPCRKIKHENFVEKIRRILDSGIVKTCDELDLCDEGLLSNPEKSS